LIDTPTAVVLPPRRSTSTLKAPSALRARTKNPSARSCSTAPSPLTSFPCNAVAVRPSTVAAVAGLATARDASTRHARSSGRKR
jgi:hypothetical protein